MAASATTPSQISQYYPVLQPLLTRTQEMIPTGASTADQQKEVLNSITNAYNAENSQFKNTLSRSLGSQVDKYIDLSHRLNDYNEIHNTNAYIKNELEKAGGDLKKLTEKLKNKIYISKQKSLLYNYEKNKLAFYKALFLISCFVLVDLMTIVTAHMNGLITIKTLYYIIGITAVIYVIAVYLIAYSNSRRTHTDWNKFVWSSVGSSNASTCSNKSWSNLWGVL